MIPELLVGCMIFLKLFQILHFLVLVGNNDSGATSNVSIFDLVRSAVCARLYFMLVTQVPS